MDKIFMKSLFEYSYDFTRNFLIFHSCLTSNMSKKRHFWIPRIYKDFARIVVNKSPQFFVHSPRDRSRCGLGWALFYGWVTNRSPLLISHGCPCMIGIIKRSLVRCFCYKKHLRKPCALVFAICWFYLNELSTKQFHSYYTPLRSWLSRYSI